MNVILYNMNAIFGYFNLFHVMKYLTPNSQSKRMSICKLWNIKYVSRTCRKITQNCGIKQCFWQIQKTSKSMHGAVLDCNLTSS